MEKIDLTFVPKSLKIVRMEGWQSGNAPDSKSGEPANTGAQVQILYLPYINDYGLSSVCWMALFFCSTPLANVFS